jgi:hypothetical protein
MAKPQPPPIRDLAFAVKCLTEARREPDHPWPDHGRVGLTDAQWSIAGEALDLALTQLSQRLRAEVAE